MGRPLKIQKYSAMSGIFTTGPTAAAVAIDQGYPPFAAPTSMDTATAVVPTGANPPWLGVVGGAPVLSQPSATYPVVECQVNIALPSGVGQGSSNGRIIRQKGNRKFLVVSSGTQVEDESMVVGASYMIGSLDTTDWQQMGAPAGATAGTIFTCTALCADPQNGYGWLVGQCVLDNTTSPTVGNMAITFSYGDSSAMYVSKLTNRFLQDFAGGETGGSANTGNVWNPDNIVNNVLFDANFFTDEGTVAKSGAETATWGVNGSEQNAGGTLNLGIVENYTS
jgi:hypothetical protein